MAFESLSVSEMIDGKIMIDKTNFKETTNNHSTL